MSAVVIHQAHFLPWIPYFSLISCANTFVILDDVQYKPRYFINRTKIINGDTKALDWISIPTRGTQSNKSNEVVVVRDRFFYKAINKVSYNYRYSDFYNIWIDIKRILCDENNKLLVDLNVKLLTLVLDIVEIEAPEILYSSKLLSKSPRCRTHRYELICTVTGSNIILSGIGKAKDVHDVNKLKEKGIKFQEMNYNALKSYCILNGLSILNSLLSNGSVQTRNLIIDLSKSAF